MPLRPNDCIIGGLEFIDTIISAKGFNMETFIVNMRPDRMTGQDVQTSGYLLRMGKSENIPVTADHCYYFCKLSLTKPQ